MASFNGGRGAMQPDRLLIVIEFRGFIPQTETINSFPADLFLAASTTGFFFH